MTDIATLEAQITEAKTALHSLMIGGRTVAIEYDGRRVQYSQGSAAALQTHIRNLEQQLARLTGTGRRRSLRVSF